MIYHLYFKSGERAYNLKLYDNVEQEINDEKQLFANTRSGVELLKLEVENLKLVSYTSRKHDRKVYIDSVSEEGYQLDITLTNKNKDEEEYIGSNFRFVKDGNNWEIYNQGSESAETYTIVFHYEEQGVEYKGKFIIDCIPQENIYEVVLDVGSEASQMLINREDQFRYSELFKNCAKHFYGLESDEIKPRTFDQQEDADEELFRSVYFLPKELTNNQNRDKNVIAKPGEKDPLLDFITKRDDSNKGQRLPNIKISYLSGECPEEIDLNDLHQGIVMRFLHEIVMEVCEKNRDGVKCGIRLYLLVPNVMEQGQLSDFINDVRQKADSEEFRQLLPEKMKEVIFDIHSYSESDASFVSWFCNGNTNVRRGNYLVIDVGKGTTDFSIIKVENGSNAVSIYRSGFVGAGNALTYAIFVNYIVTMGGLMKAKNIIKKVLSEAEEADLYRLENIIENYKKKENPIINDSNSNLKIEEGMNVTTIIDYIAKRGDIGDNLNIIQSTINKIIKKIVTNVKENRFENIILSGRAFKYKPFQTATINILEKIYHMEGRIVVLNNEQLKKGCLIGPLKSIQISKQSDMIGIPIAVDVTKRSSEKSRMEKKFDRILSETNDNTEIVIADNYKKTWKDHLDMCVSKIRNLMHFDILESTVQTKNEDKEVNLDAGNNDIVKIMRGELVIDNCNENTHFYISDDEYEGENRQTFDKRKYTLFYDGKDFYAKDDNSSILLTPCVEQRNNDMLYESLFPYPYRVLDKNCDIPEIKTT